MTTRAAIYARVSDDQQRSNYSIPEQISECISHLESSGYALVGDRFVDPKTGFDVPQSDNAIAAYVDDYTSTELSRPGLNDALDHLKRIGFDVLIVHALDRLARDPYYRQTIEIWFAEQGAKVEYVLGNYDDTPEGEVRKDLDATFAKWENAKRVERSLRGKRGKAKRGLFVTGRSPYAYVYNEESLGGLAVNEEQAKVVIRIFEWFVFNRLSIREIAEKLTEQGVKTASGKSHWGKTAVRNILTNTTYIGYCYYNKNQRRGKRIIERDKEEWIEIKTIPIIDESIFNEAQKLLEKNRKVFRRRPKRFHLLSGMVFCSDCGKPYGTQTAKAGKNKRKTDATVYRHRESSGHCCNHWLSGLKLEPIVWDMVVEILLDPDNLRKGYQESLEQQEATLARQKSLLETLARQAIKINEKKSNLIDAYVDPDIELTKTEYTTRKAKIDDELKDINQHIKAVKESLSVIPTPVELESLETFCAEIRDSLDDDLELSPEEKREIFEMLHLRVLINKEGDLRLEGWFANSNGLSSKTCSCYERKPVRFVLVGNWQQQAA